MPSPFWLKPSFSFPKVQIDIFLRAFRHGGSFFAATSWDKALPQPVFDKS
jgi:hypothetical protein